MPFWSFFRGQKKAHLYHRRHHRIHVHDLVRCLPSGHFPDEYLANLLDLSESGMQYASTAMLWPGMFLHYVINLDSTGRQIPLTGRVVWAQRFHGARACRAGVEFMIISYEDRAFIRHFVEKHIRRAA